MNFSDGAIIPVLALVTLLVFLALGIWQYNRARKAKQQHKHSSLGNTSGEPAMADAARVSRAANAAPDVSRDGERRT